MSSTLELVKRAYKAWETQDLDTLLSILDEKYVAKMPGMTMEGHEGVRKMVEQFNCQTENENEIYIEQGDRIVRIWDCIFKPSNKRARMAELTVVKDGKIIENEAFFDPSEMPQPEGKATESKTNEQQSGTQTVPPSAVVTSTSAAT